MDICKDNILIVKFNTFQCTTFSQELYSWFNIIIVIYIMKFIIILTKEYV